jgi:hypothetical protein
MPFDLVHRICWARISRARFSYWAIHENTTLKGIKYGRTTCNQATFHYPHSVWFTLVWYRLIWCRATRFGAVQVGAQDIPGTNSYCQYGNYKSEPRAPNWRASNVAACYVIRRHPIVKTRYDPIWFDTAWFDAVQLDLMPFSLVHRLSGSNFLARLFHRPVWGGPEIIKLKGIKYSRIKCNQATFHHPHSVWSTLVWYRQIWCRAAGFDALRFSAQDMLGSNFSGSIFLLGNTREHNIEGHQIWTYDM